MVKLDYANGVKDVLIRKINKAERELEQLKLDYCRFVFGLSHRSVVVSQGKRYQVRHVDLKTMTREANGDWSRPVVAGVAVGDSGQTPASQELVTLSDWQTE